NLVRWPDSGGEGAGAGDLVVGTLAHVSEKLQGQIDFMDAKIAELPE
ncbi:MAG: Unknown protein, partial [uncultured Thiotrichaceae bacterium]